MTVKCSPERSSNAEQNLAKSKHDRHRSMTALDTKKDETIMDIIAKNEQSNFPF